MQLHELLSAAREAVDAADLPAELRPVAFGKAFDLLAADSSGTGLAAPAPNPPRQHDSLVEDGTPYGAVASRLGLSRETAEALWYFGDDGAVELLVHKARLPAKGRVAQRWVALLLVAARQATGIDDRWTEVSVVRAELARYGRLESNHFAEYIDALSDVVTIRGKGAQRLLSMLPDGWQEARELVATLMRVDT